MTLMIWFVPLVAFALVIVAVGHASIGAVVKPPPDGVRLDLTRAPRSAGTGGFLRVAARRN